MRWCHERALHSRPVGGIAGFPTSLTNLVLAQEKLSATALCTVQVLGLRTLMQPDLPESTSRFGFVSNPVGIHSGKTILTPEVSLLLDAAPENADYSDFRRLVVEQNVVLKGTAANRQNVFTALARLYGLRTDIPLFHALRILWPHAENEHPLLALLLASARDSALRISAPVILNKQPGETVTSFEIEEALSAFYGERYGSKTLRSMAEHLGGSWVQAGHLTGRSTKRRAQALSGPASVAYALLLGYLCGARGVMLYETFWAGLLDLPKDQIDVQAFAAAQRGWLSYRRIGDVAEINFPSLLAGIKEEDFTN